MVSSSAVIYQKIDPFAPIDQQNASLYKTLKNLIGRIERILLHIGNPEYITQSFNDLLIKIQTGVFYYTSIKTKAQSIDFDALVGELQSIIRQQNAESTIGKLPCKIQEEVSAERDFQDSEEMRIFSKVKLVNMQNRNGLPILNGKWKKENYNPRSYLNLNRFAITSSLDNIESSQLLQQLDTPLVGFLGQAYNYDDHSLTEEWMLSFSDPKMKEVQDDDVIRTQVFSLLEILGVAVQDRVCNENNVLQKESVGLNSGILKEIPVWGIDSYTRRMIEIAIEDYAPKNLYR